MIAREDEAAIRVRVLAAVKAKGLSLRAASKAAGMAPGTLGKYALDYRRMMSAIHMANLAEVVDVPLVMLLYGRASAMTAQSVIREAVQETIPVAAAPDGGSVEARLLQLEKAVRALERDRLARQPRVLRSA